MPTQRPSKGARKIPHGAKETAAPATDQAHKGGQNICVPTEVRTKTTCEVTKNERVDLRGDVETCRREGLCVTGDESKGAGSEAEPRNRGKPQGRQKKEGGDRGRGGGDTTWGGPAEPEGCLETSKGVVQGCGQPCAAARSSYA